MTESGPRPPVIPRISSGSSPLVLTEVERLDAPCAHPLEPLGHEIDADHAIAAILRDARRHVADRPEAEHHDGAAIRYRRVLDSLPSRRQDVGEEDEAVVRRSVGDLDRQAVSERDSQQLGLASRDLPVQLRIAEQRCTLSVLTLLRRLALGVKTLLAHEASPAGDVERNNNPVALPEGGDLAADLLDEAHRLV